MAGAKDQLEYAPLENEDRDAWKQYLKKVILDKHWSTVRVTKSRMFQEFMLIRNLLSKSIKKLPNSTLKVLRLSKRSL